MVARAAEFRTFRAETARLGLIDPAQANAQGNTDENRANRKAYQAEIDGVVQTDQARFDALSADLAAFQAGVLPLILGTTLVGASRRRCDGALCGDAVCDAAAQQRDGHHGSAG